MPDFLLRKLKKSAFVIVHNNNVQREVDISEAPFHQLVVNTLAGKAPHAKEHCASTHSCPWKMWSMLSTLREVPAL